MSTRGLDVQAFVLGAYQPIFVGAVFVLQFASAFLLAEILVGQYFCCGKSFKNWRMFN